MYTLASLEGEKETGSAYTTGRTLHASHEVQGALLSKSLLLALTGYKMLAFSDWSFFMPCVKENTSLLGLCYIATVLAGIK